MSHLSNIIRSLVNVSLIILTICSGFVFAQHPISNTLQTLLRDGDYDKAKRAVSDYADNDVSSMPDSIKFDYFYLKAAIAHNDGDWRGKLIYLSAAKMYCEYSLGIHTPVYLELCWSIGNDLVELGDTVSAFEIFQAALVQSIGLYDMSDSDVAWQYEDMNRRVIEWYKNDSIRSAMAKHRPQLRQRPVEEDAVQNDMEFYIRFYKDEQLKARLQLADSLNECGQYSNAAIIYQEISKQVTDNPIAKATINELAAAGLINVNDFRRAEELLSENLVLLEDNKTAKEYRRTLSQLSNLYSSLHNYGKAKDYASKAKFWYEHCLDFSRGYILCLHRCATLERGNENYFLAMLIEDVALQEYYKNSVWGTVSGRMTEKESFLANMLSSASLHYNQLGFNVEARDNILEAIAIAERLGLSSAPYYNNLAQVSLAAKDYTGAVSAQQKAYDICNDNRERVEIGTDLGIMQFLARQPINPAVLLASSRELNRQTSKTFAFLSTDERRDYWSYFQYHLPMLNFLMYQCRDRSLYGDIYNNILQEKGLLLRTSNHIRQAIEQSGNQEDLLQYDHLLSLRKAHLLNLDEMLAVEIDKIDKSLTKKYSSYSTFANSLNITWQDIAQQLKEDDIAIEFYNIPEASWQGDDIDAAYRYCALTIKKDYDAPHIIPLCKKDVLEELITDNDIYENEDVYQLIWQPLVGELDNVHNIYFAADGDLHKIAIEYLQTPAGEVMNDLYGMYRLSSTRVIAESHHTPSRQKAVLYGGLKYDLTPEELAINSNSVGNFKASRSGDFTNLRYGVTDLPHTLQEVNDIATLFEATTDAEVHTITGADGTEEAFKRMSGQAFDIIHLATHGFFWDENKAEERNYVSFLADRDVSAMRAEDYSLLRSGLFFSGANAGLRGESLPDEIEDGVLTAEEVSTMNLGDVDMVVMSACQTGLGETTSEGVFGLQRGFKLAGANTLLMSLWKVDDEATCLLMTEFYRHYLSGKTKQESLCLAQKTLRNSEKYSDPHYWAAFILLDALN